LLMLLLLLLLQNSRLSSWRVNYELISTMMWKEYSYNKRVRKNKEGYFYFVKVVPLKVRVRNYVQTHK